MEKFPGYLDEKCFASSRTIEFENLIKRQTKGRGVDMVLNALAEEKLQVGQFRLGYPYCIYIRWQIL